MEQRDRVIQVLSENGLHPSKSLGQNFLIDEAAIAAIVDAVAPEGRLVLEIGPGLGALTGPLCARAERVVAVEKDAAMAETLARTLAAKNLTVVTQDFLDCDIAALTNGKPFAAAGNLPYYVTTPITEKLLAAQPMTATLMVQQEASERFFARPGSRVYGPLSVVSQICFAPARVLDVPRASFYPAPEVDSSVVQLVRRNSAPDAGAFLAYLKKAFAMRRKTLRNNLLSHQSGFDRDLESLGLPAGVRAEALPPETLAALFALYLAGKNADGRVNRS